MTHWKQIQGGVTWQAGAAQEATWNSNIPNRREVWRQKQLYLQQAIHSASFICYSVCNSGLALENVLQKFICLMYWYVGALQLLLRAYCMHSLLINRFLMH